MQNIEMIDQEVGIESKIFIDKKKRLNDNKIF